MSTPGYSAEGSIYRSSNQYRTTMTPCLTGEVAPVARDARVTPQLYCRVVAPRLICCWGDNFYECHYIVE
jgi:hypothetical protein